jgi:hypothetical protein
MTLRRPLVANVHCNVCGNVTVIRWANAVQVAQTSHREVMRAGRMHETQCVALKTKPTTLFVVNRSRFEHVMVRTPGPTVGVPWRHCGPRTCRKSPAPTRLS